MTKLKKGNYYDTNFIIDGDEYLDAQGINHGTMSFTSEDLYQDFGITITFNVKVINICDNYGDDISSEEHYGLFSNVMDGLIPVYYKINLDVGSGSLTEESYKYQYGEEYTLPEPTPAEGYSFTGWMDSEAGEAVTQIAVGEWGIKSYVASYQEDEETAPEEPVLPDEGESETPEEESPVSYEIVYSDSLNTYVDGSLVSTYTEGSALSLSQLERDGFIFMGWKAEGYNEYLSTLEATLQEGVLSSDNKIYLTAVWELEAPTLEPLTTINKTYDGVGATLYGKVNHSIFSELTLSHSWYTDRGNPVLCGESGSLSFLDAMSGKEYMLIVNVLHTASGLSSSASTDWVSVSIARAELSIVKKEGVAFHKTYDGTVRLTEQIERGKHYEISGFIGEDDFEILPSSATYSTPCAGEENAVSVSFDKREGSGATEANYFLAASTLSYPASIAPKSVSIIKINDDVISKTYDGGLSVPSDFSDNYLYGTAYSVDGLIDGGDVQNIEVLSILYDNKNASVAQAVNVFFGNVTFKSEELSKCYTLSNDSLSYSAEITPAVVDFKKLSTPEITKPYDGNTEVGYSFVSGVDYEITGITDNEVEPELYAEYSSSMALSNAVVILRLLLESANYTLACNELTYPAAITPAELLPLKLTSPQIYKVYDASKAVVGYSFEYGVDFALSGAVEDEITAVEYTAMYDRKDVSATKIILLLGKLVLKEGASRDNYSYAANAAELYYAASVTPLEINVSGENLSRAYGEEDNLTQSVATGVGSESISIKFIREAGEVVGEYAYVGAEQIAPVNENYTVKFVNEGRAYKIVPAVPTLVFPSFEERDYSPALSLADAVLDDSDNYLYEDGAYVNGLGKFYWVNDTIIPSALNEYGYVMEFIPNDVINYDYSAFIGYNADTQRITRAVILTINPIDPTPSEISDFFEIAVGMRYRALELPRGWSVVAVDGFLPEAAANGEVDTSAAFENALLYDHDGTANYNKLYKDLCVKYVRPVIRYVAGTENAAEGTTNVEINNSNGDISISFKLEKPFDKIGYKVAKWVLEGKVEIVPEDDNMIEIGATYTINNPDLVSKEITLEIIWEARNDIPVTFLHYYENQIGSFDEEADVIDDSGQGTADASYTLLSSDARAQQGFIYLGAKLNGEGDYIEGFTVSPLGDSKVCFYYARKSIRVEYVDTAYSALASEGSLPESKTVKYGVPFTLEKPEAYIVYGYSYLGYTDGVSFDGDSLRIFSDATYTVLSDVPEITLTLCLAPNKDTAYVIHRYFDGVEEMQTLCGVTGTTVDISTERYNGYEMEANENQKLTGDISGYLTEDGEVIAGKMLELYVYYVSKQYSVSLPNELGADFIAKGGEEIILPVPSDIPEGKEFLGWLIGGKLYGAGESFIMPQNDVVLTPQWGEPQEKPSDNADSSEGIDSDNTGNNALEDNTAADEKDTLGGGAIAGIAAGAVSFLIAVGILSAIITKRQKSRARLIQRLQASRQSNSQSKQ